MKNEIKFKIWFFWEKTIRYSKIGQLSGKFNQRKKEKKTLKREKG